MAASGSVTRWLDSGNTGWIGADWADIDQCATSHCIKPLADDNDPTDETGRAPTANKIGWISSSDDNTRPCRAPDFGRRVDRNGGEEFRYAWAESGGRSQFGGVTAGVVRASVIAADAVDSATDCTTFDAFPDP